MAHSGRPVLVLEPFSSGSLRARKQRSDEYFLSYNRSDAADRVQDIVTALAFLESRNLGTPSLIGMKDAGVWAIFAAAVAGVEVDVTADLDGFNGSDEDFHERFFVPDIQRAGGLKMALGLVKHFVRMSSPGQIATATEAGAGTTH
jgi:hypothetical protein